jgi:hypothetical protein
MRQILGVSALTALCLLAGCGGQVVGWGPEDALAPVVVLTSPVDEEIGVGRRPNVFATFSEPMDPASLTALTLTLEGGGTAVDGSVTPFGDSAVIFAPSAQLELETEYLATVTTGVTDLAGNALAEDYVWRFTTEVSDADRTPPTVLLTNPGDNDVGVDVNAEVFATFSEAMAPATVNDSTFEIVDPDGDVVTGTVAYQVGSQTGVFTPDEALVEGLTYEAVVTNGVTDLAGNTMAADYLWSFRAEVPPLDLISPTVLVTVPDDGATGVGLDAVVTATFSEAMAGLTLNVSNFELQDEDGGALVGFVTYDAATQTATFDPVGAFEPGVEYEGTITTGATDIAGNGLSDNYVWTFTAAGPADGVAPTVLFTIPTDDATNVPVTTDLTATFSEAMAALSVQTGFLVEDEAGLPVTGVVTYDPLTQTGTFNPDSDLELGLYQATITTDASDLAGNGLANNYVWTFTTGTGPDTVAPTVLLTIPTDEATNVPVTTDLTATFSEAMAALSVQTGFLVEDEDGLTVTGVVTYDPLTQTGTFNPDSDLELGLMYQGTITTDASDLAGNGLVDNYVWTFTTGLPLDDVAPMVVLTAPEDLDVGVDVGTVITATFSEGMAPLSIDDTVFLVEDEDGEPVDGLVTYDPLSQTATFAPLADLEANFDFEARITVGATDLAGNSLLSDYVWVFSTGDLGLPTVVVTRPADQEIDVDVYGDITATFSEAMDPLSIVGGTFTVVDPDGELVPGLVDYDPLTQTATFTPEAPLDYETVYEATITTDATDAEFNGLLEDYVWTFTTQDIVYVLDPIDLLSLESFVAAAGSGLTNSNLAGVTTLGGDVALSPTGSCIGDGNPCTITNPVITGTLYVNDTVAQQAKFDLLVAYNDGAGRPPGVPVTQLAGLTIAPGVYTADSALDIAVDGIVTLDGKGDPNSVWIFQVATALTVNNNVQINLIDGAKAKNVFWVVGSSSTIGTDVSFQGSVLAMASNSVEARSTVTGRLLSSTAAVTLLQNTITLPPL